MEGSGGLVKQAGKIFFGRSRTGMPLFVVGGLAVLRNIEPGSLLLRFDPQADDRIDDFQNHERRDTGKDGGDNDRDDLVPELLQSAGKIQNRNLSPERLIANRSPATGRRYSLRPLKSEGDLSGLILSGCSQRPRSAQTEIPSRTSARTKPTRVEA